MKARRLFGVLSSVATACSLLAAACPPQIQAAAADDDKLVVVSLGDSYSSGEGIEDFYGQDKAWADRVNDQDWLAHRSQDSWPGRLEFSGLTGTLKNYNVKHPAAGADLSKCKWYFVASSGAVTGNLVSSQEKTVNRKEVNDGKEMTKWIDPQLNIFNEINEPVDYVTISIGGNDVGFSKIVTSCVMYNSYLHLGGTSDLEDKLADIENNFSAYRNNIKQAYYSVQNAAPEAQIIVAGYPKLVHYNGTSGPFNRQEIDLVRAKVHWFNEQIEDIVAECQQDGMKICFVSVEREFNNHESYAPNASDEWINQVTLEKQGQDLNRKDTASSYSMHPNGKGAAAYARCVNAKIREIEEANAAAEEEGDDDSSTTPVRAGVLTGSVRLASSPTLPVPNAKINIYKNNVLFTSLRATIAGNFSQQLPAGDYRVEVLAPGYTKFIAYTTVRNGQVTILKSFLMIKGSTSDRGTVKGQVIDGVTGRGIPNALVYARRGWDNPDVGAALAQTRTDSNGYYTLNLTIGNYTVFTNKENYISSRSNVICQKNQSATQNVTMSPATASDSIRFVLEWGVDPRDLDSHLVGRYNETSTSTYHVYFAHKSAYDSGVEICNLDVDDTTSYGPETVTLTPTTDDAYYYYIYHYSGSGTVATSGATVKIYQGQTLVRTFNVPAMQGNGRYWNVFAYKDGEIIVKNTITDSPNLSYAG